MRPVSRSSARGAPWVSAEAFNSGFVGRANDLKYGLKSGVFAPRQAQVGLRYEF